MTNEEISELKDSIEIARKLVRDTYGEPTLFEHGPAHAGTPVGCGIDHQHIHVVPLSFPLRSAVADLFPSIEWGKLSSYEGTRSLYNSHLPYGLVQEPDQEIFYCDPPRGVRQFLRRAIAHALGVPEQFDYSAYTHVSNTIQTLEDLASTSP